MAAPISVPRGFKADFAFYCERAGIVGHEQMDLRNAVREDFDGVGGMVQRMAAAYRFADATWGGLPTPEQCEVFMVKRGLYPVDETVFRRCGILLLVDMCRRTATQPTQPSPETWPA